jgi:hypothetical protein
MTTRKYQIRDSDSEEVKDLKTVIHRLQKEVKDLKEDKPLEIGQFVEIRDSTGQYLVKDIDINALSADTADIADIDDLDEIEIVKLTELRPIRAKDVFFAIGRGIYGNLRIIPSTEEYFEYFRIVSEDDPEEVVADISTNFLEDDLKELAVAILERIKKEEKDGN